MTDIKAWPPGYKVNPRVEALTSTLIAAFKGVPAAHAGDNMAAPLGAVGLHSYHDDLKLTVAGPALTCGCGRATI